MTKRAITITWLIGVGVMIVGGLLALFTGLALASHIGAFTANYEYQYSNYVPDGTFWALVSFVVWRSHCLRRHRRPICGLDWSGDRHQSACGQDVVQCSALGRDSSDSTKPTHRWPGHPDRVGLDDRLPGRRT